MILIDTTPLVALCDARDAHHERAWAELPAVRRGNRPILLCEPVLTESCFHLSERAQRRRLRTLLQDLRAELLPPRGDLFLDSVFDWLEKYAEHLPDLTDAFLVILAQAERRAKVWTYDAQFYKLWRRPDGSSVPLAVRP
jgi:predicted nucleic acid-binding protein